MDKPRTYWDTFTTSYQMGHQKHRDYLLDLLKEKNVVSLLDVGCGTGPIYEIIRESNKVIPGDGNRIASRHEWRWPFKYKGTDYSPAMIEVCKQSYPEGDWQVEDARHLDEKDNSWECVLLMHSLDHLDDYKAAISEAARVSGKYVCIVLWRPIMDSDENNLNDRNMYGKVEGEEPWQDTHLQEYSRKKLEEAFKESKLKIVCTVDGEVINSASNSCNSLFLLEKI